MKQFNSNFKEDSSQSIGLSFIKAYNNWHKKIKTELAAIGITHPQFVVLASLGYLEQSKNEIKQIEISKKSDIDVMTVSTILKNLEKQQLIQRSHSKIDTRAKVVMLTSIGRSKLNKALKIVEQIDKVFFSKLGANEEQFNALLNLLTEEGNND